jgi:hypothetical protein
MARPRECLSFKCKAQVKPSTPQKNVAVNPVKVTPQLGDKKKTVLSF